MTWYGGMSGVKRALICALGLSLVPTACGPKIDSDDGGDGDGDGDDDSGEDVGDADDGDDGDDGDGDGDGDDGEPPESLCIADPDRDEVAFCVPAPPSGLCEGCDDACQDAASEAGFAANICFCQCEVDGVTCSEPIGDQCCFSAIVYDQGCIGRPFIVEEAERTAEVTTRGDWRAPLHPRVDHLDGSSRRTLAAQWTTIGLAEHASVAAFARFILDLLSLAAPPELVRDAQRALADEVEHARLAFALASAYTDAPVGPGPLSTADATATSRGCEEILVAAIVEACVGETLSAAVAAEAAEGESDDVTRRVLRKIAVDETRHAALGWRFVRWVLAEHPDLHSVARRTIEAELVRPQPDAIRRGALKTIVEPIAYQLLDSTMTGCTRSHPYAETQRSPGQ